MRFRLDTAHYFPGDIYLNEGTEIGDGTDYPIPDGWRPPASAVPLDAEAKTLYKDTGKDRPHWTDIPEENIPIHPNAPAQKSALERVADMSAAARDVEMAKKANAKLPGQGPAPAPSKAPGQGAA